MLNMPRVLLKLLYAETDRGWHAAPPLQKAVGRRTAVSPRRITRDAVRSTRSDNRRPAQTDRIRMPGQLGNEGWNSRSRRKRFAGPRLTPDTQCRRLPDHRTS